MQKAKSEGKKGPNKSQQRKDKNKLFVRDHTFCYEKARFPNIEEWIQKYPIHFINGYWEGNNPRELNIITKPTIFNCSILNSTNIFIEDQIKKDGKEIPSKGNGILSLAQAHQHLNSYLTSINEFGIIVIHEKYMSKKYQKVVDVLEKSIKGKQRYFCFISSLDLIQCVLEFSKIKTQSHSVNDSIDSYKLNCQIDCCDYHKTKPKGCCVVKNNIFASSLQQALIHVNVKLKNQDKLIRLKQSQKFTPTNYTYLLFNNTYENNEIVEIGCLLIKQSTNENNGEYIKLMEYPCVLLCQTSTQQKIEGIQSYSVEIVINYFIKNYIDQENYDFIVFDSEKLCKIFKKYTDISKNNSVLLNFFYSSIISNKLKLLPINTDKQQDIVLKKQPPNVIVCGLHTLNKESCVFYKMECVVTILNWFSLQTDEIHNECPFEQKSEAGPKTKFKRVGFRALETINWDEVKVQSVVISKDQKPTAVIDEKEQTKPKEVIGKTVEVVKKPSPKLGSTKPQKKNEKLTASVIPKEQRKESSEKTTKPTPKDKPTVGPVVKKDEKLKPVGKPVPPTLPTAPTAEGPKCCICMGTEIRLLTTKCGHLICESCVPEWFGRGYKRCPYCNSPAEENQLIKLYF